MWDVVTLGADRGLVAAGGCLVDGIWHGVGWSSEDGFAWSRLLETEPDTILRAAVADPIGRSAILLGNGDEEYRPRVWMPQPDGEFAMADLPTALDAVFVEAVAWHRDIGYLAVGVAYEGSPEGPSHAAAWSWPAPYDGGWVAVEAPSEARMFVDVRADERGFVIAGAADPWGSAIWRWQDGRWSEAIELPGRARDQSAAGSAHRAEPWCHVGKG